MYGAVARLRGSPRRRAADRREPVDCGAETAKPQASVLEKVSAAGRQVEFASDRVYEVAVRPHPREIGHVLLVVRPLHIDVVRRQVPYVAEQSDEGFDRNRRVWPDILDRPVERAVGGGGPLHESTSYRHHVVRPPRVWVVPVHPLVVPRLWLYVFDLEHFPSPFPADASSPDGDLSEIRLPGLVALDEVLERHRDVASLRFAPFVLAEPE